MNKNESGFSLIEMIIFIVVVSISMLSIMRMLDVIVTNSQSSQNRGLAVETVNQCIDWFIGNRYLNGYNSLPCPSTTLPAFCTSPSGITLSVNVSCHSKYGSPTTAYKLITVSASGNASARSSIIIADY